MEPKAQSQNPTQNQTPAQSQPAQTLTTPKNNTCKHCKNPISENFYFCPNCGKKIKEPPFKFSWGKATGVILESAFLPPLGLFPGIKYLKYKEAAARILGTMAIFITIASTIITTIFLVNYINSVNKQLNETNFMQTEINNPTGSVQNQAEQLQNSNK